MTFYFFLRQTLGGVNVVSVAECAVDKGPEWVHSGVEPTRSYSRRGHFSISSKLSAWPTILLGTQKNI
jgi:hypothetical protein